MERLLSNMNKRLRNYLIAIAIIIVLIPVFNFALGPYWTHVLLITGIMGTVTITLNLAIGFTGQMNLGHIVFFGIGAYISAILVKEYNWNFWVTLILAGFLGILGATLLSFATRKMRGVSLAIASFTLLFCVQSIAMIWSKTGGLLGIPNIPPPSIFGYTLVNTDKLVWGFIIFAFFLLSVYVVDSLMISRVGRAFISIRDDEDLAESSGINTFAYKMISLLIGAFISGIAGALYSAYMCSVYPAAVGFMAALTVCVAVCFGGIGTLLGPIIGNIMVVFLPEFLRPLGSRYYLFFAALVLILAVFLPNGIMGVFNKWLEKRKLLKAVKEETGI